VDHNKQVLEKLSCVDRVGFGARFLAENEFLELLEIEIK